MWHSILKRYWNIVLFKETPENTPCSPLLLGLVLFLFYALILIQWHISDLDHELTWLSSFVIAGALIGSYVVYTVLLLKALHFFGRVIQTLTCILAGHAIIHLCAFPLLLCMPWLLELHMIQPLGVVIGVLYLILTLILSVWQFMVSAYIYKFALEIENFPAVLAALGLLSCNILMVSLWR